MPELNWITDVVGQWVSSNDNLLLSEATMWFRWLAIIMLCLYGLRWGLDAATSHSGLHGLPELLRFGATILFIKFLLTHYNTPLPWTSVSFHQLIPETARQIAAMINTSALHQVEVGLDTALARVPKPSYPGMEMLAYAVFWVLTWFAQGILFLLSINAFIPIGIGIILGSLSIATYIFPPLKHLFPNWISFMISWSMYGVVAAALVWLWSHVILIFIARFPTDASGILASMALLKSLFFLNLGMLWSCKNIDKFTAGLYGHAVSGASSFSHYVTSRG
jgi:hypothetical protein